MRHPSYHSALISLVFVLLAAACGRQAAEPVIATPIPAAATVPESPPAAPTTAPPTATADPSPTAAPLALSTRTGADYVLLLPRESALPVGWLMNPIPDYQVRRPQAGDTYRFACAELTARSVGQASVGYRSLEGLPSIHIEYVIYATAEDAADALADMAAAADQCAEFAVGDGEGAAAVAFAPLDFPAYGDAGFARTLTSNSAATGGLLTHMIKVRQGHVVIGVNHSGYADQEPPDGALTESLVALAVNNLRNGPPAPGR